MNIRDNIVFDIITSIPDLIRFLKMILWDEPRQDRRRQKDLEKEPWYWPKTNQPEAKNRTITGRFYFNLPFSII